MQNPDSDPEPTDEPALDPELHRLVDIEKEGEDVPPDFEETLLKRLVKVHLGDKGNTEQGGGGTQSDP